ncbi:hypothetical protein ACUXAV_000696 [Cupriavidus metallidurans]|uniref:hypothetical protein n=1 Tax=Cupriavidus metallidurans TaxID=119219 RepID=UPI0005627EC0|nr:hypothetical protein [Cupriavidus metallidurans]MDE4918597.1 hypothetical protein [Cupriavidus metallidurans]
MSDNNTRLAGMREAADFVAGKADDYANQFGYSVGGTLCFDRQEKMDHYTTLTELAEEIRAMASNAASALPAAAPALAAQVAGNFDDYVVEQFAVAMKRKLAAARDKGRGGWNYCTAEDLSRMLREHVEKGDPRDVANFCMFLWYHGQPIHAHQSGEAGADAWQPISTAPEGVPLVVGWLDSTDPENPERHDFDCKEDGVWLQHADRYDHFCMVAPPGSRGPKEDAPYLVWMPLPSFATQALPTPDTEIEALFEGRAENTAVISADSAVNSREAGQ